jgi:hypothetical protein
MRPAAVGFGLSVVALAFAACGKHSTTTPTPTPTVTVTPVSTPGPSAAPCTLTLGLAYEPDAGNGNGFHGVQVTHFQANDENLCAPQGKSATPVPLAFSSSVQSLAFSPQLTEGVAVLQAPSGEYSLVQALFGALVGQLVPSGTPYNVAVQPTPAPAVGGSPTPTPAPVPLIPDVSSVAVLDQSSAGSSGVALALGPAATPPAIVALTSLQNAPPQYGSSIPFAGSNYTDKTVPLGPYSIVHVSPDQTNVLTRGPGALTAFAVTIVSAGYQFNAESHDTTLGYGPGPTLRGNGNIAYDPADSTRALVAGDSTGRTNLLYLISGLPSQISHQAQLALPGNINSIVISPNGTYAIVGTDAGIVVVDGVNSSTLTFTIPFDRYTTNASAIPYVDCTGIARKMTDVYSVGLSAGLEPGTSNYFLVALGSTTGVSCPSGHNATIAALPFNTATGSTPAPSASPTIAPTATPSPGTTAAPTPSPIPTLFYQNNVIPPPPGADYMVVH